MPHRSIAVLGGTGQQGRGIAERLALAGYPIVVGSRDPDRAAAGIAEWPSGSKPIAVADYGRAIEQADIVVLAVPFSAVALLLQEHGGRFRAEGIVIDVTVPVVFTAGAVTLTEVPEGSAAEHIRARLPPHVTLACTFKTVPAHLLTAVERPLDCDELVCGDSAEARAAAVELVQAMHALRAIDVGPLARARSIEHMTLLAIGINRRHKIHDARFRIIGL